MRRLLVMAGAGLVGVLLAGCAGGSAQGPASAAPSGAPSVSGKPTPSGGPQSLTAWGEAALPPSKPGGSRAVMREVGALTAGKGFRTEIGQDAGAWAVQIACAGDDASPITYRLIAEREQIAAGEVACGATGRRGAGSTVVDFPGGVETQLELSAEGAATFVFEVTPGASIED
ncbi:MAG TPA: hypothetical protein VFY91_03910 [Microbacterium sp.]|nr:hypothetical protein [Microbacterium sp.]